MQLAGQAKGGLSTGGVNTTSTGALNLIGGLISTLTSVNISTTQHRCHNVQTVISSFSWDSEVREVHSHLTRYGPGSTICSRSHGVMVMSRRCQGRWPDCSIACSDPLGHTSSGWASPCMALESPESINSKCQRVLSNRFFCTVPLLPEHTW